MVQREIERLRSVIGRNPHLRLLFLYKRLIIFKVPINQEKVMILICMHLKKVSKYKKSLNNKSFEKIQFVNIGQKLILSTFYYFSNHKLMKRSHLNYKKDESQLQDFAN